MRRALFLTPFVLGVSVLLYLLFFAPPSGRDILARSIAAHGGEARLARTSIGRIKGYGTRPGPHGSVWSITWEETFHQPDRLKRVFQKKLGDQTSTLTNLYRDGKSWLRIDDEEPQVAETGFGFNESIACPLGQLLVVYRTQPTCTPLPDSLVGGTFARGFSVPFGDGAPVEMYFDKETDLLVKLRSSAPAPDGSQVERERIFSQFRTVDGIRVPGRVQLYVNKALLDELVVQEVQFLERIDDKEFAKP